MSREKLGRHDEARAIYDRLTQRYPDRPHYWIALGHSQRSSGEVDAAIASYRRAVAVDYECGEAWWGLAGIKSRDLTDDDIDEKKRAGDSANDESKSVPMDLGA